MDQHLQKSVDDFKKAKATIHFEAPPITFDPARPDGVTVHFDVSCMGNGATEPRFCTESTLKLLTKDLLGLMPYKMQDDVGLYYDDFKHY